MAGPADGGQSVTHLAGGPEGSDTMHDAQWCAVRADHPDVFVNGDARRARVVDPPRPQERLSAGDGAHSPAVPFGGLAEGIDLAAVPALSRSAVLR